MLCIKCGTDLPDDSRFCLSCGRRSGTVSVGGGAAAAVAPARIRAPEPKLSNPIWTVVGIVLLLALFGASCYVQKKPSSSLPQTPDDQVSQPE